MNLSLALLAVILFNTTSTEFVNTTTLSYHAETGTCVDPDADTPRQKAVRKTADILDGLKILIDFTALYEKYSSGEMLRKDFVRTIARAVGPRVGPLVGRLVAANLLGPEYVPAGLLIGRLVGPDAAELIIDALLDLLEQLQH